MKNITATDAANPTYAYVNAFVDELQRTGVHHVVICPGSRSTPLALAFAAHPAIRVWLHIDERSAAFFGLGMAKRLGQPVALLCTSGTAAANFLPALVEARLTHIPLLVLTADRPHELRECGAPQAIDQNRLYGTHVKWFMDVALPEATNAALRYIRTLANRAAALTQAIPAGPVHLNMPFREPLTPEPQADNPLPTPAQRDPLAWEGRPDNTPYVTVSDASLATVTPADLASLADLLSNIHEGIIIAGPYLDESLAPPLVQLAQRLGYPILADPLSQLRGGDIDHSQIISSYDAFLRNSTFSERVVPRLVLRFGAMPTAKPLLLYLKRYPTCRQIVIDGNGGWPEPTQLASEVIHSDPIAFCHALLDTLKPDFTRSEAQRTWLTTWQQTEQVTRQALYSSIQDFTEPFEGRIFTELAELLPDGAALYVGNSMPVRDLDTFFWSSQRKIRIAGNRGASGIDGITSSTLGFSAAAQTVSEQKAPTVLVIGDLSFFHDLNGLLAARLYQLDLTIILVHNDGGGIFSFLPQAGHPEHFEQLFGTPTGLDFAPVVQMHGGTFSRTDNWQAFREAVTQGMSAGGLNVIEVRTERASNVTMHRQLWQAVDATLHALW
jgi:2-succinyl-5-enolpyruvyl-6-hydroxy-3-cyclohexene-1-carboxylate synthase